MNRRRAFTLIELLCVIAIIALLAGLLLPVMGDIVTRSENLKCVNNLRQIATSAHLYANDHDNKFPIIEIDPASPTPGLDPPAKPIDAVLAPYGVTDKVLQCPADLQGPNWYAKKKTSYMWLPYSEDEFQNAVTIYTPRGAFPAKLSRVRLCQDWDLVHPPEYAGGLNRMNIVYADGHVKEGAGVSR